MNFLLWLSDKLDALGKNKRQIALGALGLAALAALVFFVPLLLEDSSRLGQVRVPANVVTKPLGPPAAVQAPAPQPVQAQAPIAAPVAAPAPAPTPAPTPAPEPSPAPAATAVPQNPPVEAQAPATYQVQVGAFREEPRARRLAKRVERAGFQPVVVAVDLPDRGRFHRVRLEPALSHEEAQQLLAKLQKKMPKLKAIVVRSGS